MTIRAAILVLLVCLALPRTAAAQTDTGTLNAVIGGFARLSLSTTSLSFADEDPDRVPQIPASPAAVTITARARATAGGMVTLTVQASDDLRSGVATIPAQQITWTATGLGFVAGTLSASSPQTVATWVGSGVRTGSQSFRFRNLWTYPTGTFTLSMIYTLTAQ